MYDSEHMLVPAAVSDPMTDYEQLVKDWQTNGGEQIRKEYTESITASG